RDGARGRGLARPRRIGEDVPALPRLHRALRRPLPQRGPRGPRHDVPVEGRALSPGLNRRQVLGLLSLVPLAATAWPVLEFLTRRERPGGLRPVHGFHGEYFPNLVLRTQDGDRVRLYDDLLKGKTVLINFFYANCRDGLCPVTTQNLVQLQQLLGDRC